MYFEAIFELSDRYSVVWLCKQFSVSRAGYYNWIKHKNRPNTYELQRQEIILFIRKIHKEKPSYGYRRIRNQILKDTGWYICLPRVLSCMQSIGLQSKARKKKHWDGVGKEHNIFKNILNRNFTAKRPLQKVVTDITEFYWHGRKCFFTCYLDLFNNEMVSWNFGFREDLPFVLKPLTDLLVLLGKAAGSEPTILHSDQGSQYSSPAFTTLLKRYGIIQSMSRAGTPHDNAVIESFFGWFKEELNLDFHFKKANDIFMVVHQAVDYFNMQRPVAKLQYKSPIQFRLDRCN